MKTEPLGLLLAVILLVADSSGQSNEASSKAGADSSLTPRESLSAPPPSLGLGVSAGFQGASVYFPIIAAHNFRIEPELGYFTLPEQNHYGTTNIRRASGLSKLGVGVLYLVSFSGSSKGYFGSRVAILANAESEGYLLTPSGGVEFGSSHFSASLELRWHYISFEFYNGFIGEALVFLRAYL